MIRESVNGRLKAQGAQPLFSQQCIDSFRPGYPLVGAVSVELRVAQHLQQGPLLGAQARQGRPDRRLHR